MKRTMPRVLAMAGLTLVLAGCSGDMTKQMMSNPEMQSKVMTMITENMPMAGQMVDKLLSSDSTRTMLLTKIMGDGNTMQALMTDMSKNQTAVDGVLNLAVQDSGMRAHVMGVLEGIKMAAGHK